MANEATLVVRTEHPISMIVADGVGIEKGTLLKMSDPNTAAAPTLPNDIFAGIAAAEKIANDGVTTLAVYRKGRFKIYLSGACAVGDALVLSGTGNYVQSCQAIGQGVLSGSRVLGRALETGTNGETILIELEPMAVTGV